MNIVSKKKLGSYSKRKKYFFKEKDGLSQLENSIDYYLLKKMYGEKPISARINEVLASDDTDFSKEDEVALRGIAKTLSDKTLTKKEKIRIILSHLEFIE